METNATLSNSEFRFKNGTTRNTARIPKDHWDAHKELLCALYREKTVSEILFFMQSKHGFVVNSGQLGRKLREWGVYKYESKNRPLDMARPASGNYGISEPLPMDFPVEVVEDPQMQSPPATITGRGFFSCVKEVLRVYQMASVHVDGFIKDMELVELESPTYDVLEGLLRCLNSGYRVIEDLHIRYFGLFGEAYARGDSYAREEMNYVLIALKRTANLRMQSLSLNDACPDHAVFEYNTSRARVCLEELNRRLSAAATAGEVTLQWHHRSHSLRGIPAMDHQLYLEGWPGTDSKSLVVKDRPKSVQGEIDIAEAVTATATATTTATVMPSVAEKPEHVGSSDINMDRISGLSLTSSKTSSLASILSLAQRIRQCQKVDTSLSRNSVDGLPSSVMRYDAASISSFRLFGQASSRMSISSSVRTTISRMSIASSARMNTSLMSLKSDVPATIEEDIEAVSLSQYPDSPKSRTGSYLFHYLSAEELSRSAKSARGLYDFYQSAAHYLSNKSLFQCLESFKNLAGALDDLSAVLDKPVRVHGAEPPRINRDLEDARSFFRIHIATLLTPEGRLCLAGPYSEQRVNLSWIDAKLKSHVKYIYGIKSALLQQGENVSST